MTLDTGDQISSLYIRTLGLVGKQTVGSDHIRAPGDLLKSALLEEYLHGRFLVYITFILVAYISRL